MEELYILSHQLFVGGFAFYGNRECHGQFGVYELVAASDTLLSLCTINNTLMLPWRLFVGGNLRLVTERHESRSKEAGGGWSWRKETRGKWMGLGQWSCCFNEKEEVDAAKLAIP
jgi:hypothetical protein